MSRPFADGDAFRAVADPTRRRILELLHGGDYGPSEIARLLRHRPATISEHLRVLRTLGIVTQRRLGRTRVYHLRRPALRPVATWIRRMT